MEKIIKQTREVGTSAGVILPRSWLNKQVVVTIFSSSIKDIAMEVLKILFNKGLNEEVKGIYLFGSYARGDYDLDSDIDILVISKNINKLINYENYEISLISEDKFSKNLKENLICLSALREAKVLLNKELIEKYKEKVDKPNFTKLLNEIKNIVRINKNMVKFDKEQGINVLDGTIYSIVLRLRELYLIKSILSNKLYNKPDFVKLIGERNYSAYLRIKRDEKELNNLWSNDVEDLLTLSEKWLKELKE